MTGRQLMEALSAMSDSVLDRDMVVVVVEFAYDKIQSCEEECDEHDELLPVIRLQRAK